MGRLCNMTLREAWCKETAHSSYQKDWSKDNPSYGQCVVTALVMQEIIGGDIYECTVNKRKHFYTRRSQQSTAFRLRSTCRATRRRASLSATRASASRRWDSRLVPTSRHSSARRSSFSSSLR